MTVSRSTNFLLTTTASLCSALPGIYVPEDEFLDDEGMFDESVFNDYKLEALKDNKERVKYTIYFSLTKSGDEWTLDDLTETEQEKILGIYEY